MTTKKTKWLRRRQRHKIKVITSRDHQFMSIINQQEVAKPVKCSVLCTYRAQADKLKPQFWARGIASKTLVVSKYPNSMRHHRHQNRSGQINWQTVWSITQMEATCWRADRTRSWKNRYLCETTTMKTYQSKTCRNSAPLTITSNLHPITTKAAKGKCLETSATQIWKTTQ